MRAAISAMLLACAGCGVLLNLGDDGTPGPDTDASVADRAVPNDGAVVDAPVGDAPLDACAAPATCAPELIRKLAGTPVRLVAAGGALYVGVTTTSSVGTEHSVFRVANAPPGDLLNLDPHAAGPDELAPNSNIAVDMTGAVYWGTPNGLRRREPSAGADASTDAGITSLSALGAPVSGVRIGDDKRLHYTVNTPIGAPAPNGGQLGSCALPGCSDVQTSFTNSPLDVVTVGATRWWFGVDQATSKLVLRTGGGVNVGGEQLSPSLMVTDGSRIYWSTFDGLRMLTIATSSLTDIAAPTTAADRFNGIAIDTNGALYVTQQAQLKRCALAGGKCTFSVVATTPGVAVDVAVDATFLYWATEDGSVFRLRKP